MGTACYDSFGKNIDVSGDTWELHLLPFWSMRQQGFGRPAPGLDKQQAYAIAFANSAGVKYDYYIDDIVFYRE